MAANSHLDSFFHVNGPQQRQIILALQPGQL
ncbi:MAG: hypothetical protein JWQ09_4687 [Segetibacter sp.]|nr:hypothetical protein [Segetibacter sp.]